VAVVGVDLGGTKCLAVALDDEGVVIGEGRRASPSGAAALIDVVVTLVEELRKSLPQAEPPVVGVGVPGLVDHDGVLRFAPNLTGADGLAVRAMLEDRLATRVVVDNDATCATWGEYRLGAGRGFDDLVMVTLGTGIGGGLISGGRVLRGANRFAGEVGHMVVDPDGPVCPCGQRGCWERFASGGGLGRLAREAAERGEAPRVLESAGGVLDEIRGEHVTAAAREGDGPARELMEQLAWWVALGLANLASILDPAAFVIGGGLVSAGDLLLRPTQVAFAQLLEGTKNRPPVPVVYAELGDRAGAVGAALLARR